MLVAKKDREGDATHWEGKCPHCKTAHMTVFNDEVTLEGEVLCELHDKGTLGRYVNKASERLGTTHFGPRDYPKREKRVEGIKRAVSRLTREGVDERLCELNKGTLGRYINKTSERLGTTSFGPREYAKRAKSVVGIHRATSRLTREGVDEGLGHAVRMHDHHVDILKRLHKRHDDAANFHHGQAFHYQKKFTIGKNEKEFRARKFAHHYARHEFHSNKRDAIEKRINKLGGSVNEGKILNKAVNLAGRAISFPVRLVGRTVLHSIAPGLKKMMRESVLPGLGTGSNTLTGNPVPVALPQTGSTPFWKGVGLIAAALYAKRVMGQNARWAARDRARFRSNANYVGEGRISFRTGNRAAAALHTKTYTGDEKATSLRKAHELHAKIGAIAAEGERTKKPSGAWQGHLLKAHDRAKAEQARHFERAGYNPVTKKPTNEANDYGKAVHKARKHENMVDLLTRNIGLASKRGDRERVAEYTHKRARHLKAHGAATRIMASKVNEDGGPATRETK